MTFPPLPKEDLEHVLKHTRPLWKQLRGGRIFVTGATGFFGIWLLETFAYANEKLGLGAELLGLSRDPRAFATKMPHIGTYPCIRLIKGDVRAFEFPEGSFSHVIHAGTSPGSSVPPLEVLDSIIQGTRHILDFAIVSKTRKFLFVSSGAVYGKQPPEITHVPETYPGAPNPMDPNSAYAEGKRVGELLCALAHREHGLEASIARCFAFVGPHLPLDTHFAIGNFIRDALNGDPIKVKDGTPLRSYLYSADLAIWLWTILFKGTPCHPYNVGSDQEISIAALAKTVASTLGGAISPSSQPYVSADNSTSQPINPSSSAPTSRYVPDTNRIISELGLAEVIGLEESLLRTSRYILQSTNT